MTVNNIVLKPVVTEKSSAALPMAKYTFFVPKSINKIDVKRQIELAYSVDVVKVGVLNTHPKKRRRGRMLGKTQSKKKVVVTLKKGDVINDFKEIF